MLKESIHRSSYEEIEPMYRWKFQFLHAKKKNCKTFKPLIAAEYSGLKIPVVIDSELDASYWEDLCLQTVDGPIHGGNAIARYVSRLKPDNPLRGSSVFHHGRIEQWIEFSSLEIDANIVACCRTGTGCAVLLPAETAENIALKRALVGLNQFLASNTYLVGHSVTLADIVLTCDLYLGFTQLMPKSFTSEFPHVERYFWTLVNQPNFKKILGEVKQSESVPPVLSAKKPAPPKDAAKSKPKDEPKKEAEKEEPEPEAGEEEEAPKPKPKDPLHQK